MATTARTLRRTGAVEKPEMRRLTRVAGGLRCGVSVFELHYRHGGLHLPQLSLWLDPQRAVRWPERVVISHAHSDHTAPHREVILTAPTARFLRLRLRGERWEHVLPFGEAHPFDGPAGPFQLKLLPAGHILGSALTWIETDGERLLYTGDFKLRPGRAAEPCVPCPADVLVMETTFGRPEFRFPPAEEVVAGIVRFCQETVSAGQTALLLAYSLGKSQELLANLAGTGLPVVLHKQVDQVTQLYKALGWSFPPHERLAEGNGRGKVVFCPPTANRAALERVLAPYRSAVISGWALNPGCRYQWGVDAAFPLSDHADFPDLLRLVETVAPHRVFTVHGFASDFAAVLRERGWNASALSEDDQLNFRFGDLLRLPEPARVLR